MKTSDAPKPLKRTRVSAAEMSRLRIVGGSRWARWAVHGVLIALCAMFLYPYLWMLGTSFKTPDELADGAPWPAVPTFRAASPYVRPADPPVRPEGCPIGDWQTFRETMAERAAPFIDARVRSLIPRAATGPELQPAVTDRLVERVAARIPNTAWAEGVHAAIAEGRKLMTDELVDAAVNDSVAELELRATQVRTLDGGVLNVATPADVAKVWRVESGPGLLLPLPAGGGAYLDYDFAKSARPVVLRCDFDLPGGVAALHKLSVALRADDSWHGLEATLDVGGVRWRTTRLTPVATHRPMSLLLQPPTFEDGLTKPKLWVPLERTDERVEVGTDEPRTPGGQVTVDAENGPAEAAPATTRPSLSELSNAATTTSSAVPGSRATLRVYLHPSSTLNAVTQKVQRNYQRAFLSVPFWRYVMNSALIVVLSVLGAVVSSSLVAFAFARLHWPGRGVALLILLSTMMLPPQVTMVPSFEIWRSLGLYNTLIPLWLPSWFGSAFFIFLLIQHMRTIPRELDEAASIDGLGPVGTWWHVILPQCGPALAAIAILSFMGAWNQFMGPLIYLRDQSKFPLGLGLFVLRIDYTTSGDWPLIMAGNILMTLPVIVVFFLFQRYFVAGMSGAGLK
jgi:multiple sugar transport system permease protein